MSSVQCFVNRRWLHGRKECIPGDFEIPVDVHGIHRYEQGIYYFNWTIAGNGLQEPLPFHAFTTQNGWPVWSLTKMVWWYNWNKARARREQQYEQ